MSSLCLLLLRCSAIFCELPTRSKICVWVVANVVSDTVLVSGLEQTQTGNLVKVLSLLIHYDRHFLLSQTVRPEQLY